ncbi:hypothetical protein [Neobacillus vireti]|uniref:hypothetical protein n=1 Tax=Neobacillus vireti TaxID=220686 RepID=UPI002FFE8375
MKISFNGIYLVDSSLDYERVHQSVQDNTYDSIGDAIGGHIHNVIHNTEWYHHTPQDFDLVENFNNVQAICGENLNCFWDAANWSIMNKTELTSDIYKFITHRMSILRDGLQNNLIPDHHLDYGGIFNLIDWNFLLDCILWIF